MKAMAQQFGQSARANATALRMYTWQTRVDVKGASSIDVYASEQLDVSVSGVGSVSYSGNPKVVNKHVSGIGSVSPKD